MNKNKGSFLKGKGFYISLALIIVAAAVASFLAVNNMMNGLSATGQKDKENKQWGYEDTQVEKKQDNIKKPASPSSTSQNTQPSSTVQSNSQKAPAGSSKQQEPLMPSYALPMSGQVIANFSADELVKNKTLGDWRTHNGMDIGAAKGTEVKASMAGEIKKASYDEMNGGIVELSDGKITVRVMGLDKALRVEVGNQVIQGTVLGTLGDIASESADGEHIHVELEVDGVLCNPADYLK